MMRVSLLPRIKSSGIATAFKDVDKNLAATKNATELIEEYAALKSGASSGGVKADSVAIEIADKLRKIASGLGFPSLSTNASRSKFDQKAAIFLAQKSELSTGEGLRDDVWAFMTLVLAADVVAWRFPDKSKTKGSDFDDGEDDTKKGRVSRFSGGVRNAFQRLWVRGVTLDRGVNNSARWELVEKLTEDAMVQIFERASISGNPALAIAMAEGWLRTSKKIGRSPMESVMRSATKIIRVKSQICDLLYIPAEELDDVLNEAFETAINLQKINEGKKNKSSKS